MNKTLIISRFTLSRKETSKCVKKYSGDKLIWLCLWPVLVEKTPKESIILENASFYETNEDHFQIADFVVELSNNWADHSDFHKYNLDGLRIDKLFSYELEQSLTNVLFNTVIANRALNKHKPNKVVFVDWEFSNTPLTSLSDVSKFLSLSNFFKTTYPNIEFEQHFVRRRLIRKKIQSSLDRLKGALSNGPKYVLNKMKEKAKNGKWPPDSIVISNSTRCLGAFIAEALPYQDFFVLKDFEQSERSDIKTLCSFENVKFDEISLAPYFDQAIPVVFSKFHRLSSIYSKLKLDIKECLPKAYITVNMANSNELTKLWAFKSSGIRTIWSSEGLGQPNSSLAHVFNSVFHPEIDIERWVFSELFASYFINQKRPVRVTGYLDLKINRHDMSKVSSTVKGKKYFVFALSKASEYARRAIEGESIFEILNSVQDVASIFDELSEIEVIIKLHPGDLVNLHLFKRAIAGLKNSKLVLYGNMNELIDCSEGVIVYSSSVGLEALYRRKNVICYEHTSRNSLMSSLNGIVNHDPLVGPAIIFVNRKEELKKAIRNLLMEHYPNKGRTIGLEKVLYNESKDFSVEEITKQLLESE